MAQEESRTISENVTLGMRKRFADGKVSMPYKRLLGYRKGEDGQPEIVEGEAVTVLGIYRLFLEGKTPSESTLLGSLSRLVNPTRRSMSMMASGKPDKVAMASLQLVT